MSSQPSNSGRCASLQPLIAPTSVAIVGASDDPTRIGGRPLRYLRDSGFVGTVYPVNPNRDSVQGLAAFKSVHDLPEPVDCAVIAVPAKIARTAVEDCAAVGIKSAIVFSSGFAEVGGQGAAWQDEIVEISKRTGMRVLGPNCLGIFNFDAAFFATFSSTLDAGITASGPLAIITQSGAYGSHLYAVARGMGIGVHAVITTGNECDVDVAECIAWAAEADEVRVIAAYSEGVKNGPRLMQSLALARANGKPVIFMKVGRSAEGAAAAASHTASLAGSDAIYDAVFRQYGVQRADTTETMLDAAYACTAGIFPNDDRIGLVSISGGVGVQMADYASSQGLDVAPMPAEAQARLIEKLPFASALNPVDITAQAFNDMSLVGTNFTVMLEDGGYEVVVAFFTVVASSPYIIEDMLRELKAVRNQFPDRLIILSMVGPDEAVARYRNEGFLTFEDPCRAIAAVAALTKFGKSFSRGDTVASVVSRSATSKDAETETLSEWESRQMLATAGVPMVDARLAVNAAQAEQAATEFDGSLAMKISGDGIAHKSEIGGVLLDVAGPEMASAAFHRLLKQARRALPAAEPDGVIVSPMVSGGIETILGVQVDPVFGPAVMFGLGGIFVEVLKDVSFRVAPFDRDEAMAMIFETKGARILEGVRGRPAADIGALADALVALSNFAAENASNIESVDLNPFVVLENGQGAMALDCLLVRRTEH